MYAYYCLLEFHWKPSEFSKLDENEKILVMEMINKKMKDDKEHQKEVERKTK